MGSGGAEGRRETTPDTKISNAAITAKARRRALCLRTSRETLTGKPTITPRCGIYTTLPLSLRSSKIASNSITRPNPKPPKLRTWRGRTNCRYRRRRPPLTQYPNPKEQRRCVLLARASRLNPTASLFDEQPLAVHSQMDLPGKAQSAHVSHDSYAVSNNTIRTRSTLKRLIYTLLLRMRPGSRGPSDRR